MEEMSDIAGYEGYYQVTDRGRIWSVRNGKFCKPHRGNKYGHLKIHLWVDGKRRSFFVHRLVMLAFKGECPVGYEVAHENGDASDNRLSNLRYATPTDNNQDKVTHGTLLKGSKLTQSRLSEKHIPTIRKRLAAGEQCSAIALDYGVARQTISSIRRGDSWGHVE